MNVLSWNISWGSDPEKILACLSEEFFTGPIIACLQEVTPSVYKRFNDALSERFWLVYSLNYRVPGKFDSKSRKLGALIIASKEIRPVSGGCVFRAPYPDRTCYFRFDWHQKTYSILSFHSVTGVNYKKGKSVQFDAFAEAIMEFQPV